MTDELKFWECNKCLNLVPEVVDLKVQRFCPVCDSQLPSNKLNGS